MMEKDRPEQKVELTATRKTLSAHEKRVAELDNIVKRIYEDNINGKLTDEMFIKFSREYVNKQKSLQAEATIIQNDILQLEQQAINVDGFIRKARKYTSIQELTSAIVNEFIQKIVVHAPDKSSGKRRQKVEIIYQDVGKIILPETVADGKTA